MSKAKKIFLILVVVVVLAIVAVLGVTSRGGGPVIAPQLQYSEEQASERLETLKAAQNIHVVEVVPMRFFTDEIRPGDGTFSVTAVTTMRLEDIAAVSFRAVNSADPSAEIWYDAEDLGSGRYKVSGSAEDLGRRSGTYTIEAFITPVGGGETEAGSTELKMDLENYFYSEALGNGKQSLVLVGPKTEPESEVTGVMFKVWTVEDDQDDIKTVMAKEGPEGVWTAEIDVHDFDDRGDFIANAYAVPAESAAEGPEEASAVSTSAETADTSAVSTSAETSDTSVVSNSAETADSSAVSTSAKTSDTSAVSNSAEISDTSSVSSSTSTSAETADTSAVSTSAETADTSAVSTSTETSDTSAVSTSTETSDTSAVSSSTSTSAETADTSAVSTSTEASDTSAESASTSTSAETTETPTAASTSAETADTSAVSTSAETVETSAESTVEETGPEIGIASERFELLPDPSELPKGTGEVVKEGKRVYVKVPELIQTPELPTGCESVALTIVLQSLGYELAKTDIAKSYLEFGTDMATSYVGDPFSKNGAGCFPPAIVNAANKYLEEKKDSRTARNITGESIDNLCDYIDGGIPVILWSSMYMADPAKTGGSYTYQGQSYQWYRSEHCVVLYGYDKEKNVYLVSDPLNGYVERDAAAFQKIYDSIGKYAVVIY